MNRPLPLPRPANANAPVPIPAARTVTVSLRGGLGNQMFQYALGRALAHRQARQLFLDTRQLVVNPPGAVRRIYALDIFELNAAFIDPRSLDDVDVFGMIYECRPSFQPAVLTDLPFDHIQIHGFWQSEGYFADVASTIRHEFRFRSGPGPESKTEALIKSTASPVGVHVRRQDYLTTPAGKRLGVLDKAYYDQAIGRVAESVADAHFFVFSDDMAWCRANLAIRHPHTFVSADAVRQADTGVADFKAMTACRHFIVANSSFSWWAAWLALAADSIVVAPRIWFQSSERDSRDVVPARWIKI